MSIKTVLKEFGPVFLFIIIGLQFTFATCLFWAWLERYLGLR